MSRQATVESKPDTNRPATQEDAALLQKCWTRLRDADLANRKATQTFKRRLTVMDPAINYDVAGDQEMQVHREWVATKAECRFLVEGLPRGTTGPGGQATRQTVIMEFYGAVSRDLKLRLTLADARRINKAAFA